LASSSAIPIEAGVGRYRVVPDRYCSLVVGCSVAATVDPHRREGGPAPWVGPSVDTGSGARGGSKEAADEPAPWAVAKSRPEPTQPTAAGWEAHRARAPIAASARPACVVRRAGREPNWPAMRRYARPRWWGLKLLGRGAQAKRFSATAWMSEWTDQAFFTAKGTRSSVALRLAPLTWMRPYRTRPFTSAVSWSDTSP
jgi:hypothetical protein